MPVCRSTTIILCCLALAGPACAPDNTRETEPPESSDFGAVGTLDEQALAPDFTLTDLDGNEVRLSDSAGQVRLIDFWATFCAPCRKEVPMMNALHQRYGERGFEILAIADSEDEEGLVREFVRGNEIRYPNLLGTPEVSNDFGISVLPTAYLLDREGRVVKTWIGAKDERAVEGEIRALLGLPPAA